MKIARILMRNGMGMGMKKRDCKKVYANSKEEKKTTGT